MTERSNGGASRERSLRVGAVIALGLAVGFVLWLVLRSTGDESSSPDPTTTTTAETVVLPATAAQLRAIANATDHPVYWAGPRTDMKYELTQTGDGRIYIRYLPPDVEIGDRSGSYLIVATYPIEDGLTAVESAAQSPGAHRFALPNGGVAVWNDSAPTNVYFAYPGARYQVEVFHPNAARARALVRNGRIEPVG
jgi:hypothetical protein